MIQGNYRMQDFRRIITPSMLANIDSTPLALLVGPDSSEYIGLARINALSRGGSVPHTFAGTLQVRYAGGTADLAIWGASAVTNTSSDQLTTGLFAGSPLSGSLGVGLELSASQAFVPGNGTLVIEGTYAIRRKPLIPAIAGDDFPILDPNNPNSVNEQGTGQSNFQGASSNELGPNFVQTPSIGTGRLQVIRTSSGITDYDDPSTGSSVATIRGDFLAPDGFPIALDGTVCIFNTPDDHCFMERLVFNTLQNVPAMDQMYCMPQAVGGTTIGDQIGDATYGASAGGAWVDRGGLIRIKRRAYEWYVENELGGVEPIYNRQYFTYWQGEAEFLALARAQITEQDVDDRIAALRSYLVTEGITAQFDGIVIVQPVYWGGYFDMTDQPTWDAAYDYVKQAFEDLANSISNARYLSIDPLYSNPADYQLQSASALNRALHFTGDGYYAAADRMTTLRMTGSV